MTFEYSRPRLTLLTLASTIMLLAMTGGAWAAGAPVKEIESSHFGWEVDKTTKGKICTIASGNECQPGQKSSSPGGFESPSSVAVGPEPNDNIYVLDSLNHRVQELETDGKFVLMFGKDVNKKGTDLCTAAEEKECQAGIEGTAPGQFDESSGSIAVDPTSGDIYIAEEEGGGASRGVGGRVQEFTATGVFVLEIGREVNETKGHEPGATPVEKNLCTEEEVKNNGVKCIASTAGASPEPGAFNFVREGGNELAVGGPEDLLYVGSEHGVQEFEAKTGAGDGHYKSQILLTQSASEEPGVGVDSLALDSSTGDLYFLYRNYEGTYGSRRLVREFDTTGKELGAFPTTGIVLAIAVDSTGRLAVSENVNGVLRGSLYEVGAGLHLITHFENHGTYDLTFNGKGTLYAAFTGASSLDPAGQEIISYEPVPVEELVAGKTVCVSGPEHETDATLDCTLNGEVDPFGVVETEVWFQWGRSEALGSQTPKQQVNTGNVLMGVSAPVEGVLPNEKLYDELTGEDHYVKAPEEPLTSPSIGELKTPSVAPRIIGEPLASFVTPTSVLMFANLNPENTLTSYAFQYVPESDCNQSLLEAGEILPEACTGMLQTSPLESSEYGEVASIEEATSLRPATRYRYRLYALNTEGQGATGATGGPQIPEGSFETAPAPIVVALTGGAGAITPTSAVVSGNVNPDGQMSVYTFELGVYNGASTRYGTVFSASAGESSEPVEKTLGLSGLQPGTTYAYRITVHFGDGSITGSSATGEARTFTTLGLPAVLVSPTPLAQLSVPSIVFPKPVTVTKAKKPKKKTKAKAKRKGHGKAKKAGHGKPVVKSRER